MSRGRLRLVRNRWSDVSLFLPHDDLSYHEVTSMSMIMACMTTPSLVNYPCSFERSRSISLTFSSSHALSFTQHDLYYRQVPQTGPRHILVIHLFFFNCLGVLAGEDCFSDYTHTCVLLLGRGKRRDIRLGWLWVVRLGRQSV